MRRWFIAWLAILPCTACTGILVDRDELCTPPDLDTAANCGAEEDRIACSMPDGTKWERLPSGVWLHYQMDPLRIVCDVAPDGKVIARSP